MGFRQMAAVAIAIHDHRVGLVIADPWLRPLSIGRHRGGDILTAFIQAARKQVAACLVFVVAWAVTAPPSEEEDLLFVSGLEFAQMDVPEADFHGGSLVELERDQTRFWSVRPVHDVFGGHDTIDELDNLIAGGDDAVFVPAVIEMGEDLRWIADAGYNGAFFGVVSNNNLLTTGGDDSFVGVVGRSSPFVVG